jgi:phenylacetic acid degradation operon negative regulatory protein
MMSRRNSEDDRPLTARSVLASALLGTEPPELPVSRLVAIAGLFGLSGNRARVALSRMAAAGEVEAIDGRYRLAGHLLERQARQRQSRTPELRPWDGQWVTVVVTAPRRSAAERTLSRRQFVAARLGELREAVWLRPANLDVELGSELSGAVTRLSAVPDDPLALAEALWDLPAWADRAERLRARLAELQPRLDAHDSTVLAPGFVVSASVLRHFQNDPLLPAPLLPAGWPGAALRHEYDAWDAAYRALLRRHGRSP